MKRLISHRALAALTLAVLLRVSSANAQSGGPYDLRWNTIDAGGVTFAAGGAFMLGGTAGQPDAGASTGGPYVLAGGFWPGLSAGAAPTPTPTQTGPVPATSTATAVATATATMMASFTAVPNGSATPTATFPWRGNADNDGITRAHLHDDTNGYRLVAANTNAHGDTRNGVCRRLPRRRRGHGR